MVCRCANGEGTCSSSLILSEYLSNEIHKALRFDSKECHDDSNKIIIIRIIPS